jgi:hypothetical protein
MDISGAKFRVLLQSRLDGAKFPIFTSSEAEASEAAKVLDAEVVEIRPSSPGEYFVEFVAALSKGTNIES